MKNMRDILIVVAVGATLAFPGDADAELFQRFKARRAAKRAAAEVCVGPQCTMPVEPGRLTINRKGGFEGQLRDETYADYLAAQQTGVPTLAPTTAKVPEVPETVEVSIVVESANPVADAQAAVEAAETALAEAKATAERAVVEQQQADAREALKLQQQIEDLTARLKAVEPE